MYSLLYLFLLCCVSGLAWAAPLSVYVTIAPQKYFVEQIGGERVKVSVLVPSGQSPETFEPPPKQMAMLSAAALYYRIGMPIEEQWLPALREGNSKLEVLDAREGVRLRSLSSEEEAGHQTHHDHDPESDQPDPHIWLDPANVRVMIGLIRDRMIALDPKYAELYRANHARFEQTLRELEYELGQKLRLHAGRSFLVFHPSWGYFADAFGLRQMAIERQGREPGARSLGKLVEKAAAQGVKVVFIEQQTAARQAKAVAAELGAEVVALDPLAENYPDNLRRLAEAIDEAYP